MNIIRKIDEKEAVERLIQDLRVKARDVEDYLEKRKLQRIIKKFQIGMKEEFGN
ncbi:MAG: hypothetical protein ACTSWY_09345 [Promethearchaeota archaeon]